MFSERCTLAFYMLLATYFACFRMAVFPASTFYLRRSRSRNYMRSHQRELGDIQWPIDVETQSLDSIAWVLGSDGHHTLAGAVGSGRSLKKYYDLIFFCNWCVKCFSKTTVQYLPQS